MDLKQIHELIKIVNKSNIGEVSIEDKDGKVTIKQKEEQIVTVAAPQQVYNVAPPQAQSSASSPASTTASPAAPKAESAAPVASNTITIKSPMIGTFYRKASTDKPSLVEVGSMIEPGKVLCIIEAMKLFNEIESDVKGKIVKVLVDDSSPVEYDQPLFLVEPA